MRLADASTSMVRRRNVISGIQQVSVAFACDRPM
jgi:hypothetical protein